MTSRLLRKLAIGACAFALVACNGVLDSSTPKHERAIPQHLIKKMNTKGMAPEAPILLRIYKEENVLEVWKKDHTGRFAFLDTYEICKWSGKLGPKHKEGDKQAPEGFYHVTPALMNPNSKYHLSFNMGYPNRFDRANDRTGSYLMIHGACSSAGCYSMTDEYVEEIYALAREAFKGGQKSFQIQAFPFRMTPENLARNIGHPEFEFWKMLKEGADHFEVTQLPPKVDVCERRYVFNRQIEEGEKFRSRAECPPTKVSRNLALAFNEKQEKDQDVFDKILKRKSGNPFVSANAKPVTLNASIKAAPTVGPVGILEPAPVVVATPENSQAEGVQTAAGQVGQVASDQPPVVQQSFNPISAEITGAQAPVISAPVPPQEVAVPQKAVR